MRPWTPLHNGAIKLLGPEWGHKRPIRSTSDSGLRTSAMIITSVDARHLGSLVPRPRPAFRRILYGKATKSWAGPGYEASILGRARASTWMSNSSSNSDSSLHILQFWKYGNAWYETFRLWNPGPFDPQSSALTKRGHLQPTLGCGLPPTQIKHLKKARHWVLAFPI